MIGSTRRTIGSRTRLLCATRSGRGRDEQSRIAKRGLGVGVGAGAAHLQLADATPNWKRTLSRASVRSAGTSPHPGSSCALARRGLLHAPPSHAGPESCSSHLRRYRETGSKADTGRKWTVCWPCGDGAARVRCMVALGKATAAQGRASEAQGAQQPCRLIRAGTAHRLLLGVPAGWHAGTRRAAREHGRGALSPLSSMLRGVAFGGGPQGQRLQTTIETRRWTRRGHGHLCEEQWSAHGHRYR